MEHFFRHEFGRLVDVLNTLDVRSLDPVEDVVQAALVQGERGCHAPYNNSGRRVPGGGGRMQLEIEAVYENGTLKLDRDVPLMNGQRVKLTIHSSGGRDRSGGFRWTGRQEDLDYLILSEDNGLMESP